MSKDFPYGPVEFHLDDQGFARLDRHVEMLRQMANGYRESQGLPPIPERKKR